MKYLKGRLGVTGWLNGRKEHEGAKGLRRIWVKEGMERLRTKEK